MNLKTLVRHGKPVYSFATFEIILSAAYIAFELNIDYHCESNKRLALAVLEVANTHPLTCPLYVSQSWPLVVVDRHTQ